MWEGNSVLLFLCCFFNCLSLKKSYKFLGLALSGQSKWQKAVFGNVKVVRYHINSQEWEMLCSPPSASSLLQLTDFCLSVCRITSPRPSLLNYAHDGVISSPLQKPMDLKQLKQRAAAIPPIVSHLLNFASPCVYFTCVFLTHQTTVRRSQHLSFSGLESIYDLCGVFVTENWFAQLLNTHTPTHSSIAVASILSLSLCYRDNSIAGEIV